MRIAHFLSYHDTFAMWVRNRKSKESKEKDKIVSIN